MIDKIRISKGEMSFRFNDRVITLPEVSVESGHSLSMGAVLTMPSKKLYLFNDSSVVKSQDNRVCIETLLCDEDGAPYRGARAYIAMDEIESGLLRMKIAFSADDYVPVCKLNISYQADGNAAVYSCGKWHAITDEISMPDARYQGIQDIRGMCGAHPFVIYFADEAREIPVEEKEKIVWDGPVINAGDMTVQLHKLPDGLALGSIVDARQGSLFSGNAAEPLFRVMLRHVDTGKDELLDSRTGWHVSVINTMNGMMFRFEKQNMTVELTAVIVAEKNRIAWEAEAKLYSNDLTVVWIQTPAAYADLTDDSQFFYGYGSGRDIPVTQRTERCYSAEYPSMSICMQYMAVYRKNLQRGMYVGFHEPLGMLKYFSGVCRNGVCRMQAEVVAAGVDERCNGFRIPGQTVWQLFDGDWYDATLIYRDWVHNGASWFRGIPNNERRDVPEWLRMMPVWGYTRVTRPNWMEKIIEMREDFKGIPYALHIYDWHQIPFDTNYPHYKPAREEFIRKLPVLQAHDIKVMPYINGRLWDTHDRGDYDYQFSRLAKPHAVKDHTGAYTTECYAAKNSKGEYVRNAAMCPSTSFWQEKMRDTTSWILNELGADAVYMDQIAACSPVPCMDHTHVHRPGGGWWHEHYGNLIDHCRQATSGEKGFSTEANAETFVGTIPAMLSWGWDESWNVPAFMVIYAGYQTVFGREYMGEDVSFRILTAQSLCFGDQIGWLTPEEYLESPYRAFFKQAVELRWQYREFFYNGSCLRPPKLEGDLGHLVGPEHPWKTDVGLIESVGVYSAMWERREDGRRIIVLTNITEEPRTVFVTPDHADVFEITLDPVSSIIKEI